MKKWIWVVAPLAGVAVIVLAIFFRSSTTKKPTVTGPLTPQDVIAIEQTISRERAPLVSGEFAPKNATQLMRNGRERATGELRSIATVDGQYVVVDFGDKLRSGVGYDYELRRTTNGWKVVGMGYRAPAKSKPQ